MSQWWSWALSLVGAAGYLLVVRGVRWGLLVGLGAQVLWMAYAVVSGQWGFLFSAAIFGSVNAYGLARWRASVRRERGVAQPAA